MKKLFTSLIGIILLCVSTHAYAVTDTFTNPEDSYVRETSPTQNYGAEATLIADGVSQDPDNGRYGEVGTLIKWDVSAIPANSTVSAASITLNLTNSSTGAYRILEQLNAWDESTVSWDDLSTPGLDIGTIPGGSPRIVSLNLNTEGLILIQEWIDQPSSNNGIAIRTEGTNNGIGMDSKESGGTVPTLEITYTEAPPTLESLQAEIKKLKALLAGVSRDGNEIFMDGVNLNIRNGLGATNGNPENSASSFLDHTTVNGLGNLVVGYNEEIQPYNGDGTPESNKSGSHNIVVGYGNNYSSFGGIVMGQNNIISNSYSSVTGGQRNIASNIFSSVSGGDLNIASGAYSSVTGGGFVWATGAYSTGSGGHINFANGDFSSVTGGSHNTAGGHYSSVNGGGNNTAIGSFSTVGGGSHRVASNGNDWVAGSLFEDE